MSKPRAVGAYLYAGGFALGVNKSFSTVATFQDDNYGAATFRANFPRTPVYYGPQGWDEGLAKLDGKIDFVYANPPCAIFSSAGVSRDTGHNNWRKDPRTDCWRNTLALAKELRPTVFAVESVQQAITRGREFMQEITDEWLDRGYSVTWVKTDASRMGTPQVRKRFFLVGHKVRIDWAVPNHRIVTVREAFKGIRDPGLVLEHASYRRFLRYIKPGVTAQKWWDKHHEDEVENADGPIVGRPPFLLRRLRWDQPSSTVLGDTLIHPTENRYLGLNEAKALMGIPQDFELVGSGPRDQIARGVCPPVGAWLGRNVRRAIETNKKQVATFDLVDFS